MRELCNHSACNIWETKNIAVAYRRYTEKLINKCNNPIGSLIYWFPSIFFLFTFSFSFPNKKIVRYSKATSFLHI